MSVVNCQNVLGWGSESSSQVGDGLASGYRLVPVPINATNINGTITSIQASTSVSAALTTDGRVFIWGYYGYGQAGDGSSTGRLTIPTQVTGALQGLSATSLALGTLFVTVATNTGTFSWGYNGNYQLGK
jgi:alpha-tubulin suppressor-like RCC1 family protein